MLYLEIFLVDNIPDLPWEVEERASKAKRQAATMICLVSSQLRLRQTPALNSPSGGPGQPRDWGRGADVCSLSTVSLTATVTVGLSRRVLWSSENIYTNNNAPLLSIIRILKFLKIN